jgi:hypothetical protein
MVESWESTPDEVIVFWYQVELVLVLGGAQ